VVAKYGNWSQAAYRLVASPRLGAPAKIVLTMESIGSPGLPPFIAAKVKPPGREGSD
jgi:hypothetical protein